jgi:amidase
MKDLFLEGSLSQIRAAILDGRTSAGEVAAFFVSRINMLDRAGPRLNSVRTIAPDVAAEATRLDEAARQGATPGPLHGVPILIKDNICVAKMAMSAGSAALERFRPGTDANLVRRLRAAGAVILGKTNLTEFADYVSDIMPSSFSGVSGHVRNPVTGEPYGRGQGSSVGSAAAVAAGLAPVAIGSETQNSIQTPACMSSLVGLKPSVGAVSRNGVFPLVPSQDSPGVLARSVQDAVLVLSVIRGADLADSATLEAAPFLNAGVVGRDTFSLGVPRLTIFERPELAPALSRFLDCLAALKAAGVRIVDPCDPPTARELLEVRSSVFPTEFKAAFEAFMNDHGHPCGIASLHDLIAWNDAHPDAIPFGQSLLINAQSAQVLDSAKYLADRRADITLSRTQGIDAALTGNGVDALITPMSSAAKWTGKAGAPVIALPTGSDAHGRPFGVTLFAHRFEDAKLISIAARVENIIAHRLRPAGESFTA